MQELLAAQDAHRVALIKVRVGELPPEDLKSARVVLADLGERIEVIFLKSGSDELIASMAYDIEKGRVVLFEFH